MVKFLREQPLSPLATAAYRRIKLLDGKDDPNAAGLLQQDIAAREKRDRFEMSVCGPKCLERLIATKAISGATPDYQKLAKLCGTTDKGTTIAQMRAALSKLGQPSYSYLLNARDLSRAPLPAILCTAGHYVVLEKREGADATIYDPSRPEVTDWKIPDDDKFTVPVILLSKPTSLN